MEYKLLHLGINQANKKEALDTAHVLAELFNMQIHENEGSIFLDDKFEVMKKRYYGANGHVALGVADLPKSLSELKEKGINSIEESAVYDANGAMKVIYLEKEIAGFAVHLTQL